MGRLDCSERRQRAWRGFMLRQIGLAQPQDRKSGHTVFPKKIGYRLPCPAVLLPTRGRKRTKRSNDRGKNVIWQRAACEQRDAVLRRPTVCMSIQQKTDSLCGGNHRSLTCALTKFRGG